MILRPSRQEGNISRRANIAACSLFVFNLLVVIVLASYNDINIDKTVSFVGRKRGLIPTRKHNFITTSTKIMPPSSASRSLSSSQVADDNNASVLRELKETIKKQAIEIENLKNQAKKSSSASKVSHGGGHGPPSSDNEEEYINRTFLQLAFRRVGWLSFFLVSLSGTAFIMNNFEHTLSKQIELAYFVPLLAGHGGNTGGQTVGSVLSAISNGSIKSVKDDAPRIILKEAMAGLMVGSMLGLVFGPVVHYVMGISLHVSTVVMCTLPLASTIAATLGSSIPFICLSLGLDPTIISAPAMTSFVDVSGLLSYFIIANIIFAQFGVEM